MNYFIKLSFLPPEQGARAAGAAGRTRGQPGRGAQAGPQGREPVGRPRGAGPQPCGGWRGGCGESFEEIYSDVLLREGHPSRGGVCKNPPAC